MKEEADEVLYEVTVTGDGVSIKKTVSSQIATGVINLLMGGTAVVPAQQFRPAALDAPPPELAVRTGGTGATTGIRMSLREFLDEAQAARNPDKIVTIAEYLNVYEGTELFTKDDIKGRFRSAGEAPPGNFPRDFSWTVKNGWIAEEVKVLGSFYVTKKGRDAIANKFSGEVKKATSISTRRRGRKGGSSPEAGA